MKIVFFGSSRHVLPVIRVLKDKFELVLVITTENDSSETVPNFCKTQNIPLLSIKKFDNEAIKTIENIESNIAVLGYFGLMVPNKILNFFSKGIINLHPSLLPKYRGPTPVQEAILNGDKKTGTSIIKLDEQVDHGPVLFQKEELIENNDTADSLYAKLFKLGADHLPQVLNDYVNGDLKPATQDHTKATFTNLLKKEDGFIDADNPPPPDKITRMIRAYFPWPGVWTKWKMENGKWKILKLLPEDKIQVEGKNPMSYKDFVNGYSKGEELLKKIGLISN